MADLETGDSQILTNSQPQFSSPLNAFLDGSEFMQSLNDNQGEWVRFHQEDNTSIGTGKSFPSTYDMGDMAESMDSNHIRSCGETNALHVAQDESKFY